MRQDKVYFAAAESKDAVKAIHDKADSWYDSVSRNGYLDKLKDCWLAYHGAYFGEDGHEVLFSGEQGELVNLAVNHFRNIAQHTLGMVTATRPSFQARSVNTDYKSLVQTTLANNLLEYYMREKRLERYLKTAVEYAIVLGCGYIKMEWNSMTGEQHDFNEDLQVPVYQGDVEFSNLSPFDVVFDVSKESSNDQDWVICRSWKNKYDIAAKFPELEDEILGLKTKTEVDRYLMLGKAFEDTEDVAVYEFYHKRTESMPDGRYLMYLDENVVLMDSPMPYRSLPVYRISAGEILGTPFGYTSMFDLLPIQESVNSLYSTILSNQNAFGVQNVFSFRGSDISLNQLSGGLNHIEGNPIPNAPGGGVPQPLNLTNTPPEIFNFLGMLESMMETISGINSVARGNPESGVTAGNALALLQSQALQFISGLQQSYIFLIEDVGTGLVQMLQDFASVPRIAAIVGKNNKTEMKEFSGDDIDSISRVIVDVGNALSQCLEKDTPVIMFDGSTKMVQDVEIGDKLMGPDSKPRTVGNVNSGQETMYRITSKNKHLEVNYGCNESHILSLKYCSDDYRYNASKGDIIDISVGDYLKLSNRQKRLLQGFKTGIDFDKKELLIPPYIMGMWLGDGHSKCTALTTEDIELYDEWSQYADSIGMDIRMSTNKNSGNADIYFITSGKQNGRSDRNVMMNHLNGYNLIGNKHIPDCYLTTSREDRLELLAGLLDTDGHRSEETYFFTQKCDILAEQVMYLSRSLGFRTTKSKRKIAPSKLIPKANGYINRITIGGDTWEIPCRLKRKQCKEVKKQKNWLNYGINVENEGIGTYYGFTLIEEPHFILGDFSVSHNTTAGRLQIADNLLQMGAIKTVEQYFAVMNTGRLENMTEGITNSVLLVRSENERLADGSKAIIALATDNHSLHIQEHGGVLADPDLRLDADLVARVLAHIQEHITLLRETDPDLLAALGQQPMGPVGGSPIKPQQPGNNAPGEMPLDMPQASASAVPGGPETVASPAKPAQVNDQRPLK